MDSQMAMAFEVLDYALLSAPGAPLKQALLDAKIGKDIYGSYDDGILQPYFTIVAKGSNPDKKEQFVSVIRQVLGDIVKNGIDQKAVEAGIRVAESMTGVVQHYVIPNPETGTEKMLKISALDKE